MLINGIVLCQERSFIFENIADSFFLNTSSRLSNKKVYLLGEVHRKENNFRIGYSVFETLTARGITPDYILLEIGYSYAYLINEYVYNDLDIRSQLLIDKSELEPYTRMKERWKSSKKKIEYIGVDDERDERTTIIALKVVFKKADLENKKIGEYFLDIIDEINEQTDYTSNRRKMNESIMKIKRIHEDNPGLFASLLGNNFCDFLSIVNAFDKSIEFYGINFESRDGKDLMRREKFIAQNIYNLWKTDTNKILFGQFGYAHVNLKNSDQYVKHDFTSVAELLNSSSEYSLMNNKLCTGLIFYKDSRKRYFPFMNETIFNEYKKLTKLNIQMQILPETRISFFDFVVIN